MNLNNTGKTIWLHFKISTYFCLQIITKSIMHSVKHFVTERSSGTVVPMLKSSKSTPPKENSVLLSLGLPLLS